MRTLISLIKKPSETYKQFNDRLAEACAVMRPAGGRCTIIGTQPKVDLIAGDDDEPPMRVAVCPLDASTDDEATRTQDRLARILAIAADKPVFTADTEPPHVTICMWPLDDVVENNNDDDAGEAAENNSTNDNDSHQSDDDADHTTTTAQELPTATHIINNPATHSASAGRPPFGFRRRGGRLEENPDEADIVRTVLDAYDSGLTDDRIVRELMDAHGEWVREHWQPKEIPRHVRRIIEKESFYQRKLAPEAR
jgi:hypothetical protein